MRLLANIRNVIVRSRMRTLLSIIITLTSAFCKGQDLNLVPTDSATFEIIADSLVDRRSFLPDSIKFNPVVYKACPCVMESLENVAELVSFKRSSFKIESNKCLFISKSDSGYFIIVGQMTNLKDESEKYIWKFSSRKLKTKIAEQYISKTKDEIDKASVPRFQEMLIVHDVDSYTFGDQNKRVYATTPTANYSNSIVKLIKLSEKLIRKNK